MAWTPGPSFGHLPIDADARIEDLEEALRRIVIVVSPDGHHVAGERDSAVLAIALDQLGLDGPFLRAPSSKD